MAHETPAERAERAAAALSIYREPTSVRATAARLGVSYGTAHALIKEAGGTAAFRRRGAPTRRQPAA